MVLPNVGVSWLAILVAAVAANVLGALWYGPIFGKRWMALQGFTKKDMDAAKKKGMGKLYLVNFISSLILAYVLAYLIGLTGMIALTGGIQLGILIWIGFIATVGLGGILWEGKPFALYVLNMTYWVVNLIVMGGIIGAW